MVKRCRECIYVELYGPVAPFRGLCRRRPPHPTTHFPLVNVDQDWCGEWTDNHMAHGESPPTIPLTAPREVRIYGGIKGKQCRHCNEWFEAGPGTGRRVDAEFCSDEHRIRFHSLARTP